MTQRPAFLRVNEKTMTPVTTSLPLPDFDTIFRQIVGETVCSLPGHTSEEWFLSGLDQPQTSDQLLWDVIQTHETGSTSPRNPQQWESLKRKLGQSF